MSFKLGKFYFHSVKYSSDPVYSLNFSAVIFNDSTGTSRLNFSGYSLVDFEQITLLISVKAQANEHVKFYDQEIVRGIVDYCQFNRAKFPNFLQKTFYQLFKNYSNLNFQCPVKKNNFCMATIC